MFKRRSLLLKSPISSGRQNLFGKKMFGRKGSSKVSSGIGKVASMKSSSISPSVDEFDSMMSEVSGKKNKKKKSLFSRNESK